MFFYTPFIVFVTQFIFIQSIGVVFGSMIAAVSGVVSVCIISKSRAIIFVAALCGLVSTLNFRSNPEVYERSLLIKVVSQPSLEDFGRVKFLAKAFLSRDLEYGLLDSSALVVPGRNIIGVRQGDYLWAKGKLFPVPWSYWPGNYDFHQRIRGVIAQLKIDYASKPLVTGLPTLRERILNTISDTVFEVSPNQEIAAVFLAMALGQREELPDNLWQAFRNTGLLHLLVISGAQVGLVYLSVFCMIKFLVSRSRKACLFINCNKCAALGGLIASSLLVILVGSDVPVLRAEVALVFLVICALVDRKVSMSQTMCATLLLLSIFSPGIIFDPSLQLTLAAMLGLFIGVQISKNLSLILRAIIVSFYANLTVSAVTCIWFKQISLSAFILNPFFAPLLSVITVQNGYLALAFAGVGITFPLNLTLSLLSCLVEIIKWIDLTTFTILSMEGLIRWGYVALGLLIVVVSSFKALKIRSRF